jgi:hypothetical protein
VAVPVGLKKGSNLVVGALSREQRLLVSRLRSRPSYLFGLSPITFDGLIIS